MTALTDEGMMRAAGVMREAAQTIQQADALDADRLATLVPKLDELVTRFEAAVERLMLDAPNYGG